MSNAKMEGAGIVDCPEIEQLQPCVYFPDPSIPCVSYCYAKSLFPLRKATSKHVHKRTPKKGLVRLGTYIEVLPQQWGDFKAGLGRWSCCEGMWARPDFPSRRYFMITRGLLSFDFYEEVQEDPHSVNIQVSTDLDPVNHALCPSIEQLRDLALLPKVLFRFKTTPANAALWDAVVRDLQVHVGRVMETPIRSRVMETKLLAGHFAYGKTTPLEKAGWKTNEFMRCNTKCSDCHKENGFLACAVTPGMMEILPMVPRPAPPRHEYVLHAISWHKEAARALAELGGIATSKQVHDWFEKNHPELVVGKPSWPSKVRTGLRSAAYHIDTGLWELKPTAPR